MTSPPMLTGWGGRIHRHGVNSDIPRPPSTTVRAHHLSDVNHTTITMSLLRLRVARAPLRSLSTSAAVRERFSTENVVAPGDVVAGKAAGPPTVHETAGEIEVDVVSDAPAELRHRQVRIFKPSKNTMQSAKGKTKVWRIDWDVLQGAGRWENPLMGWASSADYMQGTTLAFRTREDAVRFVSCTTRETNPRRRGKVGSTLSRSQRPLVSRPRTTPTTTPTFPASCVSATQSRTNCMHRTNSIVYHYLSCWLCSPLRTRSLMLSYTSATKSKSLSSTHTWAENLAQKCPLW